MPEFVPTRDPVIDESGGLSPATTYVGLDDTQDPLNAERVIFTNAAGNALTDSASLVFDGTNFGVGGTPDVIIHAESVSAGGTKTLIKGQNATTTANSVAQLYLSITTSSALGFGATLRARRLSSNDYDVELIGRVNNAAVTFLKLESVSEIFELGAAAIQTTALGGWRHNTVAKTTTYTATINDHVIFYDASGGAFTIELPDASTAGAGFVLRVIEHGGDNTAITVAAAGADSVNGIGSVSRSAAFGEISLISNGVTEWIASEPAIAA